MALHIGGTGVGFKNLKGVDGKSYSIEDFKNEILVVIFSCNHCPYVKAYEDRYIALQNEFKNKDVQFVVINSNNAVKYPEDSFEKMKVRAQEKKYNFPYLYDEDQSVAKAFGATNTPHVFVLDRGRQLQYTGRIDDNWEYASKVKKHDLRDALLALTQKKQVAVTSTLPVGCTIKWK